ncbi:helix-turn-helix domain-containing protein [Agrobacterium vitis]
MSASVINWQIISLEHDTGLPLLERLPRGVQPTAAGERRLAVCGSRRRNSG